MNNSLHFFERLDRCSQDFLILYSSVGKNLHIREISCVSPARPWRVCPRGVPEVFLRDHVKPERVHPTTWSTKGWPLERVFHSRKMQEASLETAGHQICTSFIASELFRWSCDQCGQSEGETPRKMVRSWGRTTALSLTDY